MNYETNANGTVRVGGKDGEASSKPKKEKEPTSFALNNPGRLIPAQNR
jgi:hypothetical protein